MHFVLLQHLQYHSKFKLYLGFGWSHDSIVQHEIFHNFDAEEGGTFKYQHPAECIMNSEWAYGGTNIWFSP